MALPLTAPKMSPKRLPAVRGSKITGTFCVGTLRARAIPEFEAVLKTDPAYSAAYYHGGQTLEKMGRLDDAREFYRRGIVATHDSHALSELEAALSILGD